MTPRTIGCAPCLSFMILVCAGCSTPAPIRTKFDDAFERSFADYTPPTPDAIRIGAATQEFPRSREDVWNAVARAMMQQGVIARARRSEGVLVCLNAPPQPLQTGSRARAEATVAVSTLPMVVAVEELGPMRTRVYANWDLELYRRADKPDLPIPVVPEQRRAALASGLFATIATQLRGAEAWPWLTE